MEKGTIKTLTTPYIDGAFIESHGRQVMDIIKPTNGQVIAVLVPNQVIRADDLGRAMVDVAISETRESRNMVLENRDIRAMVESLRRAAVRGRSDGQPTAGQRRRRLRLGLLK